MRLLKKVYTVKYYTFKCSTSVSNIFLSLHNCDEFKKFTVFCFTTTLDINTTNCNEQTVALYQGLTVLFISTSLSDSNLSLETHISQNGTYMFIT